MNILPAGVVIKSLTGVPPEALYDAHKEAFREYRFSWSREAFDKMLHRRGFDASLSFGAFDEKALVSFTLNGTGLFNGKMSAYDTSTGTLASHRGKGLAGLIFAHSIPFLKEAGIEQYILEVLAENTAAFSVYTKQGFAVSRTFDCFKTDIASWNLPAQNSAEQVTIKEIDFTWQVQMAAMIDMDLSWQNNFAALLKQPSDFSVLGAFIGEQLAGYGILDPATGDIPQLAVAKESRRKGIGSVLLNALRSLNKSDMIRIANIDANRTDITGFIERNGIPKLVSQHEMIRLL